MSACGTKRTRSRFNAMYPSHIRHQIAHVLAARALSGSCWAPALNEQR